jgi:hypothetical protein
MRFFQIFKHLLETLAQVSASSVPAIKILNDGVLREVLIEFLVILDLQIVVAFTKKIKCFNLTLPGEVR